MCFLKKLIKLVNFCVAILILKMEKEGTFQHMLYYHKKGKNTIRTQRKKRRVCAAYEEGTVTDQSQKWFATFYAEYISLNDAQLSGKPVEVGSNQT